MGLNRLAKEEYHYLLVSNIVRGEAWEATEHTGELSQQRVGNIHGVRLVPHFQLVLWVAD